MRVVIIEDEPLAVSRLEKMLLEIDSEMEVIAKAESIEQSLQLFNEYKEQIDLIFMDIHLSDGNSFELFETVEIEIPIIFTTAYNQYALEAFKQNSVDYLLKPIKQEQLENALEKFKKYHQQDNDWAAHYFKLASPLQSPEKQEYRKRFMVYSGQKIKSVKTEDIAYCFAESKCVFMVTTTNNTYTLNYTIEKLEEVLPTDSFYRVNRKTIVAFNAIDEVIPYSKSKLKLELVPQSTFDVYVPLERIGKFKKWLNS